MSATLIQKTVKETRGSCIGLRLCKSFDRVGQMGKWEGETRKKVEGLKTNGLKNKCGIKEVRC